jgi:hypothetical protein
MRDKIQTKGKKMLNFIQNPIRTIRTLRYIASQITPEDQAKIADADTKLEKALIKDQVMRRIFPDLSA